MPNKKKKQNKPTEKKQPEKKTYEIEAIKDVVISKNHDFKVKVKWVGFSSQNDEWIPYNNIKGSVALQMVDDFIDTEKPQLKNTSQFNELFKGRQRENQQLKEKDINQVDNINPNHLSTSIPFPQISESQPKKSSIEFEELTQKSSANLGLKDLKVDKLDKQSKQLLALLKNYEIQQNNFQNCLEEEKICGHDSVQEIDYSQTISQNREEFTKSKYNDVVETFKKMKLYSPELKPLDKNDVFKEQLWHPGKIDQSLNACLIHAVNLMVGGPLFDVSSKFTQLYISRVHMTKQRQAEMHWEHGYSLKNLKHIIYDSRKKIWLSPKMIDMITGQRLRELKDNEKGGLYNYLNSIKQENRFFFQMKSENKIQQNGQLVTISELNAGVIAKVEGDWYILDSAENDKIQVKVDNRAANDWLDGVEYLGLSILEKDNPQKEKMESFLREWELILDGICIYKRKPRALKSKRRMSRKSDRKNLDRKGSRQYRCPTSEPAKPKLRKSREIQLLGKRTDSRRKIDLKAVNYLITEKAREKRWQKNKEDLDILSKSEDQHLKKLKACQNELETMQNYRKMLKKFDHLPTRINLKTQIKAPAEEETILLIAWKWEVITCKSSKLVQIKDDCSDFPKMQKRMENQLTNYTKKLYKNCHLLPIEIMDCLMRDSSLENKEHLAKWFKIQVEDKLQKHGDPRETCKPLIKVVDEIRQLF